MLLAYIVCSGLENSDKTYNLAKQFTVGVNI